MRSFLLSCCLVGSVPAWAIITIDDNMSKEEQQTTGVSKLTPAQRQALELWLNANFEPKSKNAFDDSQNLYLSENIGNGKRIRLSDGSLYEIAPADQVHTALWITPFPITLGTSNDPNYPLSITNEYSHTTVKAKKASE